MIRVLKVSLVLLVFLLTYVLAGGEIGFSRHGMERLSEDYYFEHAGGHQNSIRYTHDGMIDTVIFAKVEEFVVHADGIFVTRRPFAPGAYDKHMFYPPLSDTCEYWRISLTDRAVHGPFSLADVKNHAEWAFLKLRPVGGDWGDTMCHLDAVRK